MRIDGEGGRAGESIHLFSTGQSYVGLAPIEHGQWNIAFSVAAAEMNGNLDALFPEIQSRNPALSRAFARATRVTDWLTSPLPRFHVRTDWPTGIIPIGNAAAAIDPIGGEGIGLALQSAEIASKEIIRAAQRNEAPDVRRLQSEFAKLWGIRHLACRTAARWLSHPVLAPASYELFESNPPLLALAFGMIGK